MKLFGILLLIISLTGCADPQRFKPAGSRDWCAEVNKLDNC